MEYVDALMDCAFCEKKREHAQSQARGRSAGARALVANLIISFDFINFNALSRRRDLIGRGSAHKANMFLYVCSNLIR